MDRLSSGIALAGYAAPLLEGRRVVVFGDATSTVAAELLERGARGVHVYDPDPARAALGAGKNRSKQISVVPLDDADIAVRDAVFDVAIVEDLSLAKEPAALLKRVRRALSARGTAIVASPNADAKLPLLPRTSASSNRPPLTYYDLYDAVSAEFPEVRMLAQTPFVGYAIVDFAPEGEPEVSIDTDLVPGGAEEPEWFVAVASGANVECDPFAVVQLPAASVFGARDDSKLASDLRTTRAAETTLIERVAALEAELVAARAAPPPSRGPTAELQALEANVAALSRERDALEKNLATLSSEKRRLEDQAAVLAAERGTLSSEKKRLEDQAAALATERGTLSSEKKRLEDQAAALAAERDRTAKQISAISAERDTLKATLAKRDADQAALQARIVEKEAQIQKLAPTDAPTGDDEIARLEGGLKERGATVLRLESELREAERVGKELIRELARRPQEPDAAQAATPMSPREGGLLAAQNARLVADLEAAGWTIQELEDRLSRSSPPTR